MGDLTTTSALIPTALWNMTGNTSVHLIVDFSLILTLEATFGLVDTLIGCVANFYLLLVIVSSANLRANTRNVLIANLAAADLLVDIICQPMVVDFAFRRKWIHGCYAHLFFQFLNAIAFNFLSLWGLISIDALLFVRVARNSPLTSLLTSSLPTTPSLWRRRLKLALKVVVVALPWLLALVVVVPVIVQGLRVPLNELRTEEMCFLRLVLWAESLTNVLFFFLPISILALIFLAIAAICIVRRRTASGLLSFIPPKFPASAFDTSPASTATATPSKGAATTPRCGESNHEPISPYVVATVVTIVMMGAKHVYVMGQQSLARQVSVDVFIALSMTILILADLKSTVLPFVWLLMMPDLKEQARRLLKSWRDTLLRVKPASPTEVSVAYTNLSDD